MYPEKQPILGSDHMEEGQENRPIVTLDFRLFSLATLMLAFTSVVIVGVCLAFEQSRFRRFALGGALFILGKADSAALTVAVASAIANIQIGSRRMVDVVPRKSSGLVRVLVIAVVVAFIRGGMECYLPEIIYDWTPVDGNLGTEVVPELATDLAKVTAEV